MDEPTPQMSARILPMGERAVLVELRDLAEVLELRARLAASAPEGVVDLVPAARTVLVQFEPAVLAESQVRAWIARAVKGGESQNPPHHPLAGRAHVIEIRYDGPDLDEVAEALGLTRDAVIARHTAAYWTVAFTGFAPGFGYLVSPDWAVNIPRKRIPRTAVPAGSLGLAAEFSGVYPRETPGGWQLIGSASTRMFRADADDEQPALLAPGDTVRFRAER